MSRIARSIRRKAAIWRRREALLRHASFEVRAEPRLSFEASSGRRDPDRDPEPLGPREGVFCRCSDTRFQTPESDRHG